MPTKVSKHVKVHASDALFPAIEDMRQTKFKSLYLFKKKVTLGQTGDDFIHNNITIVFEAFSYKKPRFIK